MHRSDPAHILLRFVTPGPPAAPRRAGAGRSFLSDSLLAEHERSQVHRDMLPRPGAAAAAQAQAAAAAAAAAAGRKGRQHGPDSPDEFDAEYFALESVPRPAALGGEGGGPRGGAAGALERARSAKTRFFDFVRDYEAQLCNEVRPATRIRVKANREARID